MNNDLARLTYEANMQSLRVGYQQAYGGPDFAMLSLIAQSAWTATADAIVKNTLSRLYRVEMCDGLDDVEHCNDFIYGPPNQDLAILGRLFLKEANVNGTNYDRLQAFFKWLVANHDFKLIEEFAGDVTNPI
jgi:hypothetical protein